MVNTIETTTKQFIPKSDNWWRGCVIYQIYPASYQDDNGDGFGDLAGITRRLDYIAQLGVDAIWISPFYRSPMKDMGYDVADYRAVDPRFGNIDDFIRLLERAHCLGLKVIIDQVLSHSSDQHPIFQTSRSSRTNPKADWYVWANARADGTPPNNWISCFGGSAWEWEPRRQQYYLHNFLVEQPDFNFHNPEVQAWQLSNLRFWLQLGVDGFRLDTVNYYFHDLQLRDNPTCPQPLSYFLNPYDMQDHLYSKNRPENIPFLSKMRLLTDEYNAALLGEVGDRYHALNMMGDYTTGDSRLHMCYSFELLGTDFSAQHFRSKIAQFFNHAPDGWPTWAFSNHDVSRHVSRWLENGIDQDSLAKQSAALLLSLPGSICIYQGEELGQTDTALEYHEIKDPPGMRFWPDNPGRDGSRTPMVWSEDAKFGGFSSAEPWLPVKKPQLRRAVANQSGQPDSVLAYYRAMLDFRSANPELQQETVRFNTIADQILVIIRSNIICVFNLSQQNLYLKTNARLAKAPNYAASLLDSTLNLAANGVAFLTAPATNLVLKMS